MRKRRPKRRSPHRRHIPRWYVLLFVFSVVVIAGIFTARHIAYTKLDKRLIPEGGISRNDMQTSGSQIIDSHSNDARYDLRINIAKKSSAPSLVVPQINLTSHGKQRGVRHYSFTFYADDLKQSAFVTLPDSPQPLLGYPVIVLCHGYVQPSRYKSEGNHYLPDMEFYSRNGFAVIRPDFRGNGISEGAPEGAYYSMAYNVDLMSLLTYIKTSSVLNDQDISLWGHSMGGYLALRAAVMSPDIKRVVILGGAIGTVFEMYSQYRAPSDFTNKTALSIRNEMITRHSSPIKNPAYWYQTSPYSALSDTKAAFQIHVGAKDELIPPTFSESLRSRLSQASVPYEYYSYDNGDHGLVAQRQTILTRSLPFLKDER